MAAHTCNPSPWRMGRGRWLLVQDHSGLPIMALFQNRTNKTGHGDTSLSSQHLQGTDKRMGISSSQDFIAIYVYIASSRQSWAV